MSEEIKTIKKELAKRRRVATEIAGEIHDIVEDTLWSDYSRLPELSSKLIEACQAVEAFKDEHNL